MADMAWAGGLVWEQRGPNCARLRRTPRPCRVQRVPDGGNQLGSTLSEISHPLEPQVL